MVAKLIQKIREARQARAYERKMRADLAPSKDFLERGRERFLFAYRQKYPNAIPVVSTGFRYYVKGLATGMAVMIIISGAGVYADQKNVDADNVLYPLKRTGEYLTVTFSGEDRKPAIHASLAKRRAEELEKISRKNPNSGKLAKLSSELSLELERSLENIPEIEEEAAAPKSAAAPKEILRSAMPEDAPVPDVPPDQITKMTMMAPPSGSSTNASDTQFKVESPDDYGDRENIDRDREVSERDREVCESIKELVEEHEDAVMSIVQLNGKLLRKLRRCSEIPVDLEQQINSNQNIELNINESND